VTTVKPLVRYSAVEGALASGFATAELHHQLGHDPRTGLAGDSALNDDERRQAMNRAFRQACVGLGLNGSTPVTELVPVRIVELARAGEFEPDRMTEATVATFEK
jgi:hypothetical protein